MCGKIAGTRLTESDASNSMAIVSSLYKLHCRYAQYNEEGPAVEKSIQCLTIGTKMVNWAREAPSTRPNLRCRLLPLVLLSSFSIVAVKCCYHRVIMSSTDPVTEQFCHSLIRVE